jgi:hypothetical protein
VFVPTVGTQGPAGADGVDGADGVSRTILISRRLITPFGEGSEPLIVLGFDPWSWYPVDISDLLMLGVVMPGPFTATRMQITAVGWDLPDPQNPNVSVAVRIYLNGVDTGLFVGISCVDLITPVTVGIDINISMVLGDVISLVADSDIYSTIGGLAGTVSILGY